MPPHRQRRWLIIGRIHLHLDSYPVSGTTTTLDSLAMGIPVLTCPTLTTPGLFLLQFFSMLASSITFASDPAQLPAHARWLADRYRTSHARRDLAMQVRQSPICDAEAMPRMFVEQLLSMLRQKRAV